MQGPSKRVALDTVTLSAIDDAWAQRLGIEVARLRSGAPICASSSVSDARLFALELEGRVTLYASPLVHGRLQALESPPASLMADEIAKWCESARLVVERTVGPAVLAYRLAGRGDAEEWSDVRVLRDIAPLESLRANSSDRDWEWSGFADGDAETIVGVYESDDLVAAALYSIWEDRLAHIGVLTSERCRGRGLARIAVTGVLAEIARVGLVAQYRTLEENAAAISVAQHLGFETYGRTLSLHISSTT